MAEAIEQWIALAKASTSRNEPFGHDRRSYCFKCAAIGHEAHECRTALQHSQLGSRAGGGVVPGEIRPKLNELHARYKCHGEVTKKSRIGDGDARTEVWRKDQGA